MHLQEDSLRSSEASLQCSIGYGEYLIFTCSIVLLHLYCIVVMEVTLFIGSDTHIIIG